ncbi:MAG: TetR/AcrR family transcriptional regulator [Pseudoclavibacter sp.]
MSQQTPPSSPSDSPAAPGPERADGVTGAPGAPAASGDSAPPELAAPPESQALADAAGADADAAAAAAPAAGQGRTALLRATISVGLSDGISGITSRSVAEAAGVAHSLVRYHFGTIDALITEALGLAIDEGIDRGKHLSNSMSIADFTEGLVATVESSRESLAFLFEALLESRRRPDLFPQVERYYRQYRDEFSKHVTHQDVTDQGLIDVIFFAFEGMIMKEVSYPDQAGTRRAIGWLQERVAEHTGRPVDAAPEDGAEGGAGASDDPSDDPAPGN